jgi:hypothetical protein
MSSNVGVPGQYVFDVTNAEFKDSKYVEEDEKKYVAPTTTTKPTTTTTTTTTTPTTTTTTPDPCQQLGCSHECKYNQFRYPYCACPSGYELE